MALSISSKTKLANGVEVPLLGLGTYKTDEGPQVEGSVRTALELGYQSIDTASLYGNERGIGRVLAESGVARGDVFIATKVWNDEQGYAQTLAAIVRSLERLGTDYVDLYLVHWPIPRLMADTWRAMEEILARGEARAIGVCNFLEHHLHSLIEIAETPPMVDQFEHHPRLQQPGLVELCRAHGIQVEAWAPTMRGRVLDIPDLVAIGAKHGKTAIQVTLRWDVQRGIVAIPKSVHAHRIRENADIFDFELDPHDMAAIEALDRGQRIGPHPDTFPGA